MMISQLVITVDKIPDKNHAEEEGFILAHGSRGSVPGGLAPRQSNIMAQFMAAMGWGGSQGYSIVPKGTPSMTYFLQPDPTCLHDHIYHSIVYLNY